VLIGRRKWTNKVSVEDEACSTRDLTEGVHSRQFRYRAKEYRLKFGPAGAYKEVERCGSPTFSAGDLILDLESHSSRHDQTTLSLKLSQEPEPFPPSDSKIEGEVEACCSVAAC
jgi:hypothetical protein